ncbi:hypothetical protein Gogos_016653, partial [Gossypium gossypioides]|nr:hypothetical protein [Gossypium gossypioides]
GLDSSTERVLRRSARRVSSRNHVSSTPPPATTCDVAGLATSPSVSAVTEEKPVRSSRKVSEEPVVLPPKLQLPPSSENLNLDGISVLDIFSIYACLRSFSTLLFLSPFELEDFVAALKCQSPSSLFDCIHVSILQTVKKHLVYLSSEGSESASECLRLDSFDAECPSNYYHRDDLIFVLDVLKSSFQYGDIIEAICKQWDVAVGSNGASNNFDSLNSACSGTHRKVKIPTVSSSLPLVSSAEICVIRNETADGGKPEEKEVAEISGHRDIEVAESTNMLDLVTGTEIPYMSSEGSAETMQMGSVFLNFQKQGSVEVSNQSEIPGKCSTLEDSSLISNDLDARQESKTKLASQQTPRVLNAKRGDASQLQPGTGYVNHYSFAQTASLVVEELLHKPSEKTNDDSLKSLEEIIGIQMKVILKKSNRFHWPDIHNLYVDARKENCGWCFSCRYPVDDTDCLFRITSGCVPEVSKSEMVDLQSRWNKKGHVIDVIYHIFSIENRLSGLLSGPWLNPQYMKIWHKSILNASGIASIKHFFH